MKQITVLVVDDDRDVLSTLTEILTELRLSPVSAENGREALDIIRTRKIDLMITDLMMPQMNGFELIQNARRLNVNIPIAVISGHGEVRNVVSALTQGAYNFITKPFTIREIENIVKRGLRLREFSLGTHRLLEGVRNSTEMTLPNYPHLLPSVALYVVRECQWRGIEDEAALSNISICVDELLTNALLHGNDLDEGRSIFVTLAFDQEKAMISVEDQGQGFDHRKVLGELVDNVDTLPERRGLFIVHYLMDEVFFNDTGNKATMVKYLEPEVKRVLQ